MIVVGLSHHNAPIAVRERLAVSGDRMASTLADLRSCERLAEAVLLSTCNRVEVYAAAASEADEAALARDVNLLLAKIGGREVAPHLVGCSGPAAVKHLFRVASSLDSLVVGEPQILGQLKEAVRIAQQHRLVGPLLSPALRHALSVAKRVRSETEIGAGQVSVPAVAVELAQRIFDDLRGHAALLVGAGEMAEAAAKLLGRKGAELWVVNRNEGRAAALAAAVGGAPRPWSKLPECLVAADIVVASTASPEPVLTRALVKSAAKKRRGRHLFLIDIAVPRDVEPSVAEIDNVYVYDIDDLQKVVADTLHGRAAEADRAEAIVAAEARRFSERRSHEAVSPVIAGLREQARRALAGEIDRSLKSRLKHLGAADREALEAMMCAAINKWLHEPSTRLKALAKEQRSDDAVAALVELFDLGRVLSEAEKKPDPELTIFESDEAAASDEAEGQDGQKSVVSEERRVASR